MLQPQSPIAWESRFLPLDLENNILENSRLLMIIFKKYVPTPKHCIQNSLRMGSIIYLMSPSGVICTIMTIPVENILGSKDVSLPCSLSYGFVM